MSISSAPPPSGVVFAAELQEFVHHLSSELAQSARETNRSARETELREGLRAAEETHDKADTMMVGACVSGAMTAASGALQLYGSTQFQCTTDTAGSTKAEVENQMVLLNVHNSALQTKINAAGTLSPLGSAVERAFNAVGEGAESRAQAHQAEAKAAGHQADEAETDRQIANKVDESVRQLWQEVNRTQHAAMLAIFANR